MSKIETDAMRRINKKRKKRIIGRAAINLERRAANMDFVLVFMNEVISFKEVL